MQAITVTALNKYVKEILEKDVVLTDIGIKGEISNFVNHYKTGHFYFTVKDKSCSVKAVMFKTDAQKLSFMPQNGMNIIVFCRVSLFERDGSFQIYVTEMLPDGVGAMQLAFEQLKEKLLNEGLFDENLKKKIPQTPHLIALVTSETGAALQDIINVIQRRCPLVQLSLVPVTVQGSAAAAGIAEGIFIADSLNADTIIVARGGGSKEDLWVFNDERIARAAFNAKTPLISAIGHEIDFTILDFVADLRAPTPSAAAELSCPNLYAVVAKNTQIYTNIKRNMQNRLNLCYNKLILVQKSHILANAASAPKRCLSGLSLTSEKIFKLMHLKLEKEQQKLSHMAEMAQSLSPFKVLSRGYAIVKKDGIAQGSVKLLSKNDDVSVEMRDGTFKCSITQITEVKNAKL